MPSLRWNLGEFEIAAFSVIYYVMILQNELDGMHNNPYYNKLIPIVVFYGIIGPCIYTGINQIE